ncbi:hypothetical protein GJ744_007508 [Endocarpon pusillum]|uniref:STB6-like N-terminal domain-containing protein n=1 Tax=Endocarpon pusillum TaxID=364733 RepID=A0A8H7AIQ8_9EURO|nr:hypothetical protein GJ744_007508 [Endocarpon pusillum]
MSTYEDPIGRSSNEHPSQVRDHVIVPALSSPSIISNTTSSRHGRKRLVFSDPVAFRYLEEDSATNVLERRRRLQGYEIYIVEQWACSRIHPTFIIATYTGDSSHSILVGVLSVPKDENTWSPRLKVYFKAMSEYHARERDTPLGTLMVTNLSGFPSSLSVISVPDGDVRKHREDFIVNENLKRLGCAGRAGLNLQHPQPSTTAKFHHLYRTSENVRVYDSVMELVKLCQVSLSLYGKLAPAYADGLLCDITERSINDWWSDIGTYLYNIEPSDGILGPSTVSALVGLLMGAFNRMKAFGAPVGKDVFDIKSTKRAIGYFQKAQRMERTRRLDRQTLLRLHKVTAKTASGEGWTVPKAVKSTVAELSGKGGEMVMGIVGGREKAGIADVETLDIERLAQLVTGTKARWLWQGKAAKSNDPETLGPFGSSGNDKIFSEDDQGNYIWTSKHRESVWTDDPLQRTNNVDDAENKTGLERLKGAVGLPGLRSHQPRQSKEEARSHAGHVQDTRHGWDERDPEQVSSSPSSGTHVKEAATPPQKAALEMPDPNHASRLDHNMSQISLRSESASLPHASEGSEPNPVILASNVDLFEQNLGGEFEELRRELSSDTYNRSFRELQVSDPQATSLRRTQSLVKSIAFGPESPRVNRVPRSLSSSAIESVVLQWDGADIDFESDTAKGQEPQQTLLGEQAHAVFVREKADRIYYLQQVTIPFTERQISDVDDLDQLTQRRQDELNTFYYERLEDHQTQKATSTDIMADERQGLNEGLRRVEMLGAKLDYEVDALTSRIEEVEDGVAEFDRAVSDIEARVDELVNDGTHKDPWWLILIGYFKNRKS